jgi:transcriptional antiterminator RfaH
VPYLPKLLVHRRHGSRRWQALEPLFPGYLFARFDPQSQVLYRIRRMAGVMRLLWNNESLVPIDDDIVRFIMVREADRGFIEPPQVIRTGMRVRFDSGPFAMLEGIVDRRALRRDRVRVLLVLMGAPVSVEVDADTLESC